MLNRLFALADVDYPQWRALSRAYTMIDYAAIRGAYGHAASMTAARHLLLIALTWTFFGFGSVIAVVEFDDAWLSATIAVSTTSLLVAFLVLAQASTLLAPEDYEVVGFRPVTSRTYFAVRVTAILLQTIEMTVFTSYLPALGYLIRSHGSASQAAALVLASFVAAITTTVGLTSGYAWLLAHLKPSTLTRCVTYGSLSMLLSLFALDGMFFVRTVDFTDARLLLHDTLSIPRVWSSLWFPPVWFGSFVELAAGGRGRVVWTAAGASVAALLALAASIRTRATANYAMHVAQGLTQTRRRAATPARWRYLSAETRAIALITLGQLRDDMTFQMNAAMMFIMPALFFGFAAYSDLGMFGADPFVSHGRSSGVFFWSVLMAPAAVLQTFSISAAYEASWVFFTTPSDRVRLVLAARDIAAVCLLAPLTLATVPLMWWAYRDLGHALLQAAFIGAFAYIRLQLGVMYRAYVPFSRPGAIHGRTASPFPMGFLPTIAAGLLFFGTMLVAFRSLSAFAITAVAIVALIAVLNYATKRRLAARIETLRFVV